MFINNKYSKIYHSIINNAKSQCRVKRKTNHKHYVYYEEHHITPQSLGGSDDSFNLVLLTAREHFLCHYLLCKMVPEDSYAWHKVVRAFTFMYSSSAPQRRYVNSKLYESARKNIGRIMSESQSGTGNSQYGTVWISHVKIRDCRKVKTEELQTYLEQGYIQKRIVSWSAYDAKTKMQNDRQRASILKKISAIDDNMSALQKLKSQLEAELLNL